MKGIINKEIEENHPDNYTGRKLNIGDIVYEFNGCTYGCISPDGIAISFNKGENPFYQINPAWVTWE